MESAPESFGDVNDSAVASSVSIFESSNNACAESVCHGKSSNVGFESTFAKGGSKRNYATSEQHFPLP